MGATELRYGSSTQGCEGKKEVVQVSDSDTIYIYIVCIYLAAISIPLGYYILTRRIIHG